MSRSYDITVEINDYNDEREDYIIKAYMNEWNLDRHDKLMLGQDGRGPDKPRLTLGGEGNLCGGETEEQFVKEMTEAIWLANGGFCEVIVDCTCLENLPCASYSLNKDRYAQWKKEYNENK